MKKTLLILLAVLFVAAIALSGCSNSSPAPAADDAVTEAAAPVADIGEDAAKAAALEKAGITETAAENLTVKTEEVDGVQAYIVAFEWSGFEYEYTVNAATGDIIQEIFDGDVIE